MRSGLAALAVIGIAAAVLAACSPVIRSHGYTPVAEQLDRIRPGVDTRGSVQRKIGRPAIDSLFGTGEAWFYVSSTVKEESYKAPRIVDRKVVEVRFDAEGRVSDVGRYGLEDRRVIDLATGTTPTHGSQLTVLQQLFGNIGTATGESLLGE